MVSCAVIIPKSDGSICITLDACYVSKAIISANRPILKQYGLKSQLAVTIYLSVLVFKLALSQLELHPILGSVSCKW